MTGMNRYTGKFIEGVDHINQSIEVGITTPLGSRIHRRWLGLDSRLIDRPANVSSIGFHVYAIAQAFDKYKETRWFLSTVNLLSVNAQGQVALQVNGGIVEGTGALETKEKGFSLETSLVVNI